MYKRIVIFDLDETAVDSAHRTPNHPDGTLNLPLYLEMKTRENTLRDGLHPLADFWRGLCRETNYIMVCTARTWKDFDQEFLDMHGLFAHKILHRKADGSENHMRDPILKRRWISRMLNLKQFQGLPVIMFDDAKPVISEMRKMGLVCLNAVKVNERLDAR